MIQCKVCGGKNADDAVKCAYCGASLIKADSPTPTPTPTPGPFPFNGIDFNLPFGRYAHLMGDDDLYKVALAKITGLVLTKDENQGIEILIFLAKKGHLDSLLKLASICLEDKRTFSQGITFLKRAAMLGSIEAVDLLSKLGISVRRPTRIEIETPDPDVDPDDDDDSDPDVDLTDEVGEKTVLIKAISSNGKTMRQSMGVAVSDRYVVTTYDAIYHGGAKLIQGRVNVDGASLINLRLAKASPSYNLAILKITRGGLDAYDEELEEEIGNRKYGYVLDKKGRSISLKKCRIVGIINKDLASRINKAIKIKGIVAKELASSILFDEDSNPVGVIMNVGSEYTYAAPIEYVKKVVDRYLGE